MPAAWFLSPRERVYVGSVQSPYRHQPVDTLNPKLGASVDRSYCVSGDMSRACPPTHSVAVSAGDVSAPPPHRERSSAVSDYRLRVSGVAWYAIKHHTPLPTRDNVEEESSGGGTRPMSDPTGTVLRGTEFEEMTGDDALWMPVTDNPGSQGLHPTGVETRGVLAGASCS